jgi:hypothetical protein
MLGATIHYELARLEQCNLCELWHQQWPLQLFQLVTLALVHVRLLTPLKKETLETVPQVSRDWTLLSSLPTLSSVVSSKVTDFIFHLYSSYACIPSAYLWGILSAPGIWLSSGDTQLPLREGDTIWTWCGCNSSFPSSFVSNTKRPHLTNTKEEEVAKGTWTPPQMNAERGLAGLENRDP